MRELSQFENIKRIHRSGAYRKHAKEVANSEAKSKAIEKKKGESWESAKNKYHEAHLSETKRHKRLDGTEVKY